jgi:hypothetical protein
MRRLPKIRALGLFALFIGFFAFPASATTYYVDINSPNPTPPYTSWATAATNIQSAINQTTNGDLVLVNPGTYQTGGETVNGYSLTNRVAIDVPIKVQSVAGPAETIIQGYQVPGATYGNSAVRCVYLTNNATLIGFTLTDGATMNSGDADNDQSGGGIFCESTNCLLINCFVFSNKVNQFGGGVYSGTLSNCTLADNSAYTGGGAIVGILVNCILSNNFAGYYGGGADLCTLNNCTLSDNMVFGLPPEPHNFGDGGGAFDSTLNNCLIVSNSAGIFGGGADSSILNNCLAIGNSAASGGGVASDSILRNCTIMGNSASESGGGLFCGASIASVSFLLATNCIVCGNNAPTNSNYLFEPGARTSMNYCCTTPLPVSGAGNITNDPAFVNSAGGDFHLQSNSPCINAGNNAAVTNATDLDGNPRIVGGTVDIGAYEYQTPTSVISYAYLQQYGLPTDGSMDYADLDGTAFNVYQDWVAGLNPTNSSSVLAMLTPSATNNANGITVTWQSVSGISYDLLRSTNLPAFTTIQSNITGQTNTTSYTDTSATNNFPYFYRVSVLAP